MSYTRLVPLALLALTTACSSPTSPPESSPPSSSAEASVSSPTPGPGGPRRGDADVEGGLGAVQPVEGVDASSEQSRDGAGGRWDAGMLQDGSTVPSVEDAAAPLDALSAADAGFDCTGGVHVPGDYALIQTAINAGEGTICVGAGVFPESLSVGAGQNVTIVGVSPAQTTITSISVWYGALDLANVTVTNGVAFGMALPSRVSSSVLRVSTLEETLQGVANDGCALNIEWESDVEVTDCDISAPLGTTGPAVCIYAGDADLSADPCTAEDPCKPFTIRLRNNLIHDSQIGIDCALMDIGNAPSSVVFTDNVIERIALGDGSDPGNLTAGLFIDLTDNPSSTSVSYTGNTITSCTVGVDVEEETDQTIVTHSGNDVSGNATNYAGTATPG